METDTLSSRMRRLREARGWSLTELAQRSGVSYNHVYKLDRGSRRQAGSEILAALADALGTTTDYLTGGTDDWRIPTDDDRPVPGPEIADMIRKLNTLPGLLQVKVIDIIEAVLALAGQMLDLTDSQEFRTDDPQLRARLQQLYLEMLDQSPAERAETLAVIHRGPERYAAEHGLDRSENGGANHQAIG